jgi:aspartate racemase
MDTSFRLEVHRVIYEELCQGEILPTSRDRYREIVAALVARGAEGVILGCTEIGLLLCAPGASVELFDTAAIRAEAAVSRALGGEG